MPWQTGSCPLVGYFESNVWHMPDDDSIRGCHIESRVRQARKNYYTIWSVDIDDVQNT
jgi:hypothetical protein